MAISMIKKPTPQGQAQQDSTAKDTSKGKLSFLKRGKEAAQTFEKEEHKAELASKNKSQRFWMPNGGETKITFLDGELKDGMFDIPFFYQHSVHMNGTYNNHFVCTQDEEPCPICEGGDQPSYVGVLSVIDHGEWTSKKDGKIHRDEVKLFVVKRATVKVLMKEAAKRGGLTGCEYDVSRTGDKEASVGNVFSFNEKYTLPVLAKKYGSKDKVVAPFKYDEVISFMPASELRKLGFGSTDAPIGSEKPQTDFNQDL